MINSRVVRPWRAHADGLRVAGFVYYYFLFSSSSSYVCVCVCMWRLICFPRHGGLRDQCAARELALNATHAFVALALWIGLELAWDVHVVLLAMSSTVFRPQTVRLTSCNAIRFYNFKARE